MVEWPERRGKEWVYSPIEKCIYCNARVYDTNRPERKLAEEHIVPKSLGGSLVLPEASCAQCEGITSAFEGTVARTIFGPLRIHFNLPTRRPKERPEQLPVYVYHSPESEPVKLMLALSEHPLMCSALIMNPPKIISGLDSSSNIVKAVFPMGVEYVDYQLRELAAKLGAYKVEIKHASNNGDFALFLAKIGHASLYALHNESDFEAFLPKFILEKNVSRVAPYIGGVEREPDEAVMHQLDFRIVPTQNGRLIVISLGLFQAIGMPWYDIVAGRLR